MHCQNEIFYVYLEVNELESLVDDVTLKHFGRQEHSDVAVRLRNKIKVLKPLKLYNYLNYADVQFCTLGENWSPSLCSFHDRSRTYSSKFFRRNVTSFGEVHDVTTRDPKSSTTFNTPLQP